MNAAWPVDHPGTACPKPLTRDEIVEAIYQNHGCSCEAHYSNGDADFCQKWRRKRAELIADVIAGAST